MKLLSRINRLSTIYNLYFLETSTPASEIEEFSEIETLGVGAAMPQDVSDFDFVTVKKITADTVYPLKAMNSDPFCA